MSVCSPCIWLQSIEQPQALSVVGEYIWLFKFTPWSLETRPRSKILAKTQPRTQALSTTRLAGGKTLVQAGHVSPRFWEITKFLHKGGGLSFILPT